MKFTWVICVCGLFVKKWLCLSSKRFVVDSLNLNVVNKPEYSKWINSVLEEELIRNAKDDEMVSDADFAQIHTKIGLLLPKNAVFYHKALEYLRNGLNGDFME